MFNPSKVNKWKELSCSHKMCFSCFLKLQKQTCPFCRKLFKYTHEENILRSTLNINYKPYTPPSQLNNMNDLINSFIELDTDNYNYNIPIVVLIEIDLEKNVET